MTGPNRATVWLRLQSGRCDPVEVDIDPPDTLAALAKWEGVTGRTDLCVVTVRPARLDSEPPNPVLGLPAIDGEPADSLLDHLADEHRISEDTGRFVLHAQGVAGRSKSTTSTTPSIPRSSSAVPTPPVVSDRLRRPRRTADINDD
jgi:hypothetical protein